MIRTRFDCLADTNLTLHDEGRIIGWRILRWRKIFTELPFGTVLTMMNT